MYDQVRDYFTKLEEYIYLGMHVLHLDAQFNQRWYKKCEIPQYRGRGYSAYMSSSANIAGIVRGWEFAQRGHVPKTIYDVRKTSCLDAIKLANREAYLDHRANIVFWSGSEGRGRRGKDWRIEIARLTWSGRDHQITLT